jgi:hypothetical protein
MARNKKASEIGAFQMIWKEKFRHAGIPSAEKDTKSHPVSE